MNKYSENKDSELTEMDLGFLNAVSKELDIPIERVIADFKDFNNQNKNKTMEMMQVDLTNIIKEIFDQDNEESKIESKLKKEKTMQKRSSFSYEDHETEISRPVEESATNEHPETIYSVMHQLTKGDIAYGKHSDQVIQMDNDGNYVDELGSPIEMTREILRDIYKIEKKSNEVFEMASYDKALEYLREGGVISVEYDGALWKFDRKDPMFEVSLIPLNAILEGVWFTVKK